MCPRLFSKCVCVWTGTSSVDSKVVVIYFVYIKKIDFFSVDASWLEDDECQFLSPILSVLCMWLCSLLSILSIQQPKLILLICWHYHWIFCIQRLDCFDATKMQLISIKKRTNYSTIALLNIFLGLNLSLWKTGVATPLVFFCFFFLPISTTFSSPDGQCRGCVEVEFHTLTAGYIFTGHSFF